MILLALGANLPSEAGSPADTLRAALRRLEYLGIKPMMASDFFVTTAWPEPRDPEFLNAVASIATQLSPRELMSRLHDVEAEFGRRRDVANAPRPLDLDLLDYHGRVEAGPPELPHPRMGGRGFVLIPMAQVAPGWRHPVSGITVEEMIAMLPAEAATVRRIPSGPAPD
ncbi:MAG TPA: 2-amino-4-hydroxy-6-hydroxymethyldihydropteridine diphosphokinase [Rhizomicrobium sp.]|nr:2-amino-4-hydroxy-6-hydroxymethyldihydropteridine diphosphokinase [Rhizomicrobium sp.]